MEEQKKQKPKIEMSRGYFWLLLFLPSILVIITVLAFLELMEFGIYPYIPSIAIISVNLFVIIIVIASRTISKASEARLSEEIELKNYETYSKQFYVDWRKVTQMVYSGKIEEKTCGVCKLPLHEKEFILQCPECQALFHGQHLIEWLGNDDACPLCVSKIKIT